MHVGGEIGNGCGRGVYGVLLNFKSSLAAMATTMHEPPYQAPPRAPILYIKPANTWIGADAPILLPAGESCIEVGATVGIVFGRTTVRVAQSSALDYVAGFIVANDVSLPHTNVYRPALKQRCRDSFCALGANIVAPGAMADIQSITLRSYVNGTLRHEANTRDLVRALPQLIADVSEFMTLMAADILFVGVALGAPQASHGDLVRVEAEGVGAIENRVISQVARMKEGQA